MPNATLDKIDALPVIDILGAELCATGLRNGRVYTSAEFDPAAVTAAELKGDYHIRLKLGQQHARTQMPVPTRARMTIPSTGSRQGKVWLRPASQAKAG